MHLFSWEGLGCFFLNIFVEHNFLWFGGSAVSRLKIVKKKQLEGHLLDCWPGRLVENLIIFLQEISDGNFWVATNLRDLSRMKVLNVMPLTTQMSKHMVQIENFQDQDFHPISDQHIFLSQKIASFQDLFWWQPAMSWSEWNLEFAVLIPPFHPKISPVSSRLERDRKGEPENKQRNKGFFFLHLERNLLESFDFGLAYLVRRIAFFVRAIFPYFSLCKQRTHRENCGIFVSDSFWEPRANDSMMILMNRIKLIWISHLLLIPIGSMYGMNPYIYHKNQPSIGNDSLHGSYGIGISHTNPPKVLRIFPPTNWAQRLGFLNIETI